MDATDKEEEEVQSLPSLECPESKADEGEDHDSAGETEEDANENLAWKIAVLQSYWARSVTKRMLIFLQSARLRDKREHWPVQTVGTVVKFVAHMQSSVRLRIVCLIG